MTREEILKEVQKLVSQLTDAEITEETNLHDDLGFDSLDDVELIMNCEKHFGIRIPDEEAGEIDTIKEMIDGIQKLLPKAV
jgi:acyl carrier protein